MKADHLNNNGLQRKIFWGCALTCSLLAFDPNFALAEELAAPIENNFADSILAEPTSATNLVVIPIGLIEWDMSSLTWGGLFGALGAILENAVAGDQHAQTSRTLSQAIESSTDPRRLLAQNLVEVLNTCGRSASVSKESFATDRKPSEWKNSKSPQASYNFTDLAPNGNYVEAGVQRFWIDKQIFGTYLHGGAQINVFDANGKYIDYFSDYSGLSGRVKLTGDLNAKSDAAVKEIEDGVKKIVGDLSKNLGGKFCKSKT